MLFYASNGELIGQKKCSGQSFGWWLVDLVPDEERNLDEPALATAKAPARLNVWESHPPTDSHPLTRCSEGVPGYSAAREPWNNTTMKNKDPTEDSNPAPRSNEFPICKSGRNKKETHSQTAAKGRTRSQSSDLSTSSSMFRTNTEDDDSWEILDIPQRFLKSATLPVAGQNEVIQVPEKQKPVENKESFKIAFQKQRVKKQRYPYTCSSNIRFQEAQLLAAKSKLPNSSTSNDSYENTDTSKVIEHESPSQTAMELLQNWGPEELSRSASKGSDQSHNQTEEIFGSRRLQCSSATVSYEYGNESISPKCDSEQQNVSQNSTTSLNFCSIHNLRCNPGDFTLKHKSYLEHLSLSIEMDSIYINRQLEEPRNSFFKTVNKINTQLYELEIETNRMQDGAATLKKDYQTTESKILSLMDSTFQLRSDLRDLRYLDDLIHMLQDQLDQISLRIWPFTIAHSPQGSQEINLVV